MSGGRRYVPVLVASTLALRIAASNPHFLEHEMIDGRIPAHLTTVTHMTRLSPPVAARRAEVVA